MNNPQGAIVRIMRLKQEHAELIEALVSMTGWVKHLAEELNRKSIGSVSEDGPVSFDVKTAEAIIAKVEK